MLKIINENEIIEYMSQSNYEYEKNEKANSLTCISNNDKKALVFYQLNSEQKLVDIYDLNSGHLNSIQIYNEDSIEDNISKYI